MNFPIQYLLLIYVQESRLHFQIVSLGRLNFYFVLIIGGEIRPCLVHARALFRHLPVENAFIHLIIMTIHAFEISSLTGYKGFLSFVCRVAAPLNRSDVLFFPRARASTKISCHELQLQRGKRKGRRNDDEGTSRRHVNFIALNISQSTKISFIGTVC